MHYGLKARGRFLPIRDMITGIAYDVWPFGPLVSKELSGVLGQLSFSPNDCDIFLFSS